MQTLYMVICNVRRWVKKFENGEKEITGKPRNTDPQHETHMQIEIILMEELEGIDA